jgi:ribosomal protein S18 acetylase RimI-like enzyme
MSEDGLVIRAATADDGEGVIALWIEAFVTRNPQARGEPYTSEDFHESLRTGATFVACKGDAIVGTVAVFDHDGEGITLPGEAEVFRLAVAKAARRQGVGRALVERCHEEAQARGAQAMALWSSPHQTAAHGMYESMGYRRVPARDSMLEDGREQLVFRLELG